MLNAGQDGKRVSNSSGKSTKRSQLFSIQIALAIVFVMAMQATFASAGNAAMIHFSQAQINSYVKIVTAEIELTSNRGANFGSSASSKLYCSPTVFGQGMRSGNQGLYVWVTCSAMRKLELSTVKSNSGVCAGFSVPVWIEANATSVSYRAISNGAEYIAYRSSAPSEVQAALDATYKQIYASGRLAPSPKAFEGKTGGSFASLASCK